MHTGEEEARREARDERGAGARIEQQDRVGAGGQKRADREADSARHEVGKVQNRRRRGSTTKPTAGVPIIRVDGHSYGSSLPFMLFLNAGPT